MRDILNIELVDITFHNIENLQAIAEYEFYLINLYGITGENSREELFIKVIKKGKIKESLFCICDLAYEKYFNNNSREKVKRNQKITILEEKECIRNVNKVFVNLFENNMKQRRFNMEINFTQISNILEKYNMKGWKKYIDLNQDDILIIGRKNSI